MRTNPIVESEIWCVRGENEDMNLKGENVWVPVIVDLLDVSTVKSSHASTDEEEEFFDSESKAVVYLKNGEVFTIREQYEKVAELFKKVKYEQYACS